MYRIKRTFFFSYHFYSIIKRESYNNKSATVLLLEEWGTSGRVRPTVEDLLLLLVKVELYRAANYVAEGILHEERPPRPTTGPAAAIDITLPPRTGPDARIDITLPPAPPKLSDARISSMLNGFREPNSSTLEECNGLPTNDNNIDNRVSIDNNRVKVNKNYLEVVLSRNGITTDSRTQVDLIEFSKTSDVAVSENGTTESTSVQQVNIPQSVFSAEKMSSIQVNSYVSDTNAVNESHNIPLLSAVMASASTTTATIAAAAVVAVTEATDKIESDYQLNSFNVPDIETLHIGTSRESADEVNFYSDSSLSESNIECADDASQYSDYLPNVSLLNGQ